MVVLVVVVGSGGGVIRLLGKVQSTLGRAFAGGGKPSRLCPGPSSMLDLGGFWVD